MNNEKIDITLTRKYTDKEIIKRTLNFIKPVRNKFIVGILLIIVNVVLNVTLPYIMGLYTNVIDEKYMTTASLPAIIFFSVIYLLIIILNMILNYVEIVMLQKAGQTVVFGIRQAVFEKIETFSHEQLAEIPVGRLVTRVTNDTNSLNELYTSVLVNLLKYSLTLVGILGMMIFINPLLTLYMLGIMVLIVIATLIYRHYSKIAFREERKQISNLNSFLSENLSGMKITQVFNQEERKYREFTNTNNALFNAKKKVMYVFAYYRPTISFLYYAAIAMVFFVGFPMVLDGKEFFGNVFKFGQLVSYYSYSNQFFGPIQNISEQLDKLQSGIVASERIFNILDMDPTVKNANEPLLVDRFLGKIEFKHVYFAYKDEEWILKDVSFTVYPGQTVAFVGATGAGKTTILSLIERNYDIQKGQILIDGIDIKDIDMASLRSKIGQMLQDVFMFSGTIKDNITLFNDDISDDEIQKAIKYVNADTFINKLPEGLNTEVNEKGNNFSAGQRQLISFARTIISKPQILILDEATANIDTETEVLIQDSLNKMKSIGTMLIVAHRLSTIQHADNIICLSHGEIVEQGSHQQLLKKKGYYYKLYQLQFDTSI